METIHFEAPELVESAESRQIRQICFVGKHVPKVGRDLIDMWSHGMIHGIDVSGM
jgi:hypothetical protein